MRNLYFKIFIWFWLAMALVGTAFVISTVTTQTGERDERWQSLVAAGLTLNGQRAIDLYQTEGREALVTFFERLERRADVKAYLFDPGLNELSGSPLPEEGAALAAAAADSDELEVRLRDDGRLVAHSVTAPAGDEYVMIAEMSLRLSAAGRFVSRGGGRRGDDDRQGDRSGSPWRDRDRGDGLAPGRSGPERRDPSGRGFGPAPGRGPVRGGPQRPRAPWYWVWLSLVDEPRALAFRLLAVFLTAGILCYGLARYLTAPVLKLRDATHRLTHGELSARVGPAVGNRRDELAELGRDFDLMAERIESLLTTQRQLMSDISHELRSPLARLNVALAIARQKSGAEAVDALDRIEGEAEHLNQLIGQVLVLARLEGDRSETAKNPVDLARLVGDVAADADFEARAKGCSVRVVSVEPCTVSGNEHLLRSAIENVVRNAVRYTAEGSDVEIGLSCGPQESVVTVRDRGPGVPEEHLDDLFRPFHRIADSRDRESGGTGLGLAITDRAVRAHGGSVRAQNADDGGLIVELVLPLADRSTETVN